MNQLGSILVLGLLTLSTLVQQKPDETPRLPKGSELRVVFSEPLTVETAKVGDPVRLRIVGLVEKHGVKRPRQPLALVGHITEVRSQAEGQPESRLGISFDKILVQSLEQGQQLTVSAVIKRVLTVEEVHPDPRARVFVPDDPVARAAGPMVDRNGNPVAPQIQHSEPARTGVEGTYEWPLKDFILRPDDSAGVTVIVCKKRNIILGPGTPMIVTVTSSSN